MLEVVGDTRRKEISQPTRERHSAGFAACITHNMPQHFKVSALYGFQEREFVGEILVEGADAHAGSPGDGVRVDGTELGSVKNVSSRFDNGIDRHTGTDLAGNFPRRTKCFHSQDVTGLERELSLD